MSGNVNSSSAVYGAPGFTDVDALLRQGKVEAVLVGTPPPLHAAPAIRAAQAGVHVLVEKPLAATLTDCDAMLAAANRAGVLLGVISQRRLYEPVRRMKEAIDAGKIGRPALGVFTMSRFAQMDATTHYHGLQIRDFLRGVREGRPPLVTGEDGRAVVELFTAIYRSNREAQPVVLGTGAG
jgi:predicted dehydrogenase